MTAFRGRSPWAVRRLVHMASSLSTEPVTTQIRECPSLSTLSCSGVLPFFACCWQRPASDSGCNGQIPCADCDFDCDGSVGPGDLAWLATGWGKLCDDPLIQWPACTSEQTISGTLLALSPLFAPDVKVRSVIVTSPSPADATGTLPPSISSMSQGQDYYVELWASDVGSTNTGLTSVYLDVDFGPRVATSVQSIDHGGIFTVFPSGTAHTHGIEAFRGSLLPSASGHA